jgi:hypothetical protein
MKKKPCKRPDPMKQAIAAAQRIIDKGNKKK